MTDDQPATPPHAHLVSSWKQENRDNVGYCACGTECARQVDVLPDDDDE